MKPPERIILIVVDTLRADHVSAYATAGETEALATTPNIDRLAATGQVFRNAIAAFHATTMSMAALFTGLTPSIESGTENRSLKWNTFASCGMSRFSVPGEDHGCVPQSLDTLAEDLGSAGYWTLGVVSNELLYRPAGYDQGFDAWVEVGPRPAGQKPNIFKAARRRTAAKVNRQVLSALAKRPSDRFFLYIHYIDVHDWSLFRRSYQEAVEIFDREFGVLLDQLESQGLLENAALVFTSDHGEMLVDEHRGQKVIRHYGNPAYEPVLKVPLIVTPPIKADVRALVRSQDVRGMISQLAGLPGGPAPDLAADELFVSEMSYQNYRLGRWKSIWARSGTGRVLFDLVADPGELIDRADEHPDILLAHRRRVDELSEALSSNASQAQSLTDQDLDRLRALGYLDSADEEFENDKVDSDAP